MIITLAYFPPNSLGSNVTKFQSRYDRNQRQKVVVTIEQEAMLESCNCIEINKRRMMEMKASQK